MGSRTGIEWTRGEDGAAGATWTPIRARNISTGKLGHHCEHATTGCQFCYAERINKRLGTGLPFKPGHRKDIEIFLDEKMLLSPLRWKTPRNIFVCSMTDLFASFVEDYQIAQVFGVMTCAVQHIYQVLTKRSARMQALISSEAFWDQVNAFSETNAFEWSDTHARRTDDYRATSDDHDPENPPSNVWLGTSAERQEEWDKRKEHLRTTPAAVRFASFEPLLGPIIETRPMSDFIQWSIVGGESGPGARAMKPEWARSLKDQCEEAGVPFFYKQTGAWIDADVLAYESTHKRRMIPLNYEQAAKLAGKRKYEHHSDGTTMIHVGKKAGGRLLDGREHNEMPKVPA